MKPSSVSVSGFLGPSRVLWAIVSVWLLLGLCPREALAQGLWACGGEGEPPCSCLTDFFWENGNLFADRGLQATGFRRLPPVRFNATEWANLNRVDMTLAAKLINVDWPAFQQRFNNLTAADFLSSVCVGTVVEGVCYAIPPSKLPGWFIAGQGCVVPAVIPIVPSNCEINVPGIPSTTFNWLPDFGRPGWSAPRDLNAFLAQVDRVLVQFPPAIRGIPGLRPGFQFPNFQSGVSVNLDDFQASLASLKRFFVVNAAFFTSLADVIHDFTDPPAGAVCVNDTRHQVEPAAFLRTWTHWAVQNQEHLARFEPFNWYSRLGTHNAFNNTADGYVAPNQKWSLTDQLNLGSRYVSLDVHWFAGRLRLSHAESNHNGAGLADRFLSNAIKEIARWLRSHTNEVILISLEDRSDNDHHAEFIAPFEAYLGDLVYRARPGNPPWGLTSIDPNSQWPSTQTLRELGKRVLVKGSYDHGSDIIWTGVPSPSLGSFRALNFAPDRTNWVAIAAGERIGPVLSVDIPGQYETRSAFDPFEPSGYLTAAGLADRIRFNIPELSLDMLHAQEDTAQCPGAGPEVCNPPDRRIEALVWSWAPGQPENALGGSAHGRNAAIMNGNTGRWEARQSEEVHYFACALRRSNHPTEVIDPLGTNWVITTRAGSWAEGPLVCAELNASIRANACRPGTNDPLTGVYAFAAPVNALQNVHLQKALLRFRAEHGLPSAQVWIACHDPQGDGQWDLARSAYEEEGHEQVLRFDGQDDAVRVPEFGSVTPVDEVTIEFWQKVGSASEQVALAVNGESSINRITIHSPWVDGNVYWDFGNILTEGRLAYRPPVELAGSWQHFAMVASRSGNFMKIFRNGVQEAFKTGMTPFTPGRFDLVLGAALQGEQLVGLYRGDLDEVRIWSRARTETEIRSDLHRRLDGATPGLLACWHLDAASGIGVVESVAGRHGRRINGPDWVVLDAVRPLSSEVLADSPMVYYRFDDAEDCSRALDISGNSRHGSYHQMGFQAVGAFAGHGRTLLLTNRTSRVEVNRFVPPSAFTLSAWVKTDTLGQGTVLLGADAALGTLFRITMDAQGQITIQNHTLANAVLRFDTHLQVPPSGWHHIAIVHSPQLGEVQVRAYLDGRIAGAGYLPSLVPDGPLSCYLGASKFVPATTPALLDEWIVHPAALSADRIRAQYLTAAGGFVEGRVTDGLVGQPDAEVQWGWAGGARSLDEVNFSNAPWLTTFGTQIRLPAPDVSFPPGSPTRDFAVEFDTLIQVPFGSIFNPLVDVDFRVTSRDGARVFVDNRLVLDNDGIHDSRSVNRRVGLSGGIHRLRIQSFSTTSEPLLEFGLTGASLTGLVSAKWVDAGWVAGGSTLTRNDGGYALGLVAPGALVRALFENWSFTPMQVRVTPPQQGIDFTSRRSPPTLSQISDPPAVAVDSPVFVEFEIGDSQSSLDQLVVSVEPSVPSLFPVGRIQLSGAGVKRSAVLNPEPGQVGISEVRIVVTDPDGLSTTASFRAEVRAGSVGGVVSGGLVGVPGIRVESGWTGDLRSVEEIPLDQPLIHLMIASQIDFDPGLGAFYPGGPVDSFALEVSGTIEVALVPPFFGTRNIPLRLESDGGARLEVDGEEVLSHQDPGVRQSTGRAVQLSPGLHPFRLLYFENDGPALLRLFSEDRDTLIRGSFMGFWDTQWRPLDQAVTDSRGRYTLHRAPVGATVRAVYPGWTFAPAARVITGQAGNMNFAVEDLPRLTIHRSGNQVVLEWPKTGGTYSVQAAGGISPAAQEIAWLPVEVEILESATLQRVVIPVVDQHRWFRLIRLR
ncbi:MAG: hypothetical protein JNN07_08340 [Verrucomicrobiales bacterium]|nr:hypothetical protein [Verrucomicrobiales bacterium]